MLFAMPALVEEAPTALPGHVWAKASEACEAARKGQTMLVVMIAEDATRRNAFLYWLNSLEGASARAEIGEIWLPEVGDAEANSILDKAKIQSRPVLAWMDPRSKKITRALLGEDCVPVAKAMTNLIGDSPEQFREALKKWLGTRELKPFEAYSEARAKDPLAAENEPHRTMLQGLLEDPEPSVKNWAATRLFEAGVSAIPGKADPRSLFFACMDQEFSSSVMGGNRDRLRYEKLPASRLGSIGELDPKSPVWKAYRDEIRKKPAVLITKGLYALMAPNLKSDDRDWVYKAFVAAANATENVEPYRKFAFWLATDWLLCFGEPKDWADFEMYCLTPRWKDALQKLRKELEKVSSYWGQSPKMQDLYCGLESEDAFWKTPEPCLAQWGITRESLIKVGTDRLKLKKRPGPPRFPDLAKQNRLTTTLQIKLIMDGKGQVQWMRPSPGYALAFFAPTGLEYASRWSFEPARMGGVAVPSTFSLSMPFALR